MKEIVATVRRGATGAAVGRRLARTMAGVGELPVSRVEDAALVCATLLDTGADHSTATVRFVATDGELRLQFDGLPIGGAQALLDAAEVPDLGSILPKLVDEVVVETADVSETLLLVMR